MSGVFLSFNQYKLLEEFYKGRIARLIIKEEIYLKDRWAFVENLGNRIKYIDKKILQKLINDKYLEIYEDDGFTKLKITKKGKSLVYNNRRVYIPSEE